MNGAALGGRANQQEGQPPVDSIRGSSVKEGWLEKALSVGSRMDFGPVEKGSQREALMRELEDIIERLRDDDLETDEEYISRELGWPSEHNAVKTQQDLHLVRGATREKDFPRYVRMMLTHLGVCERIWEAVTPNDVLKLLDYGLGSYLLERFRKKKESQSG